MTEGRELCPVGGVFGSTHAPNSNCHLVQGSASKALGAAGWGVHVYDHHADLSVDLWGPNNTGVLSAMHYNESTPPYFPAPPLDEVATS